MPFSVNPFTALHPCYAPAVPALQSESALVVCAPLAVALALLSLLYDCGALLRSSPFVLRSRLRNATTSTSVQ